MDETGDQDHRLRSAREMRRYLARLRTLAVRLEHQAALVRNGGFNPEAEAQAGRLADDAFAIRWALRRIEVGPVDQPARRAASGGPSQA